MLSTIILNSTSTFLAEDGTTCYSEHSDTPQVGSGIYSSAVLIKQKSLIHGAYEMCDVGT